MIDKRNMTSQKVDLVFARHKDKKARHVTYPQFVECLEEISSIRYPGLEEYRTFSGQSAQLLKLFRSTIFPCRWAVRVRTLLFRVLARVETVSHLGRLQELQLKTRLTDHALQELTKATVMLQKAYHGRNDARNAVNVRNEQRSLIQRLRQGHAALIIQTMWKADRANLMVKSTYTWNVDVAT